MYWYEYAIQYTLGAYLYLSIHVYRHKRISLWTNGEINENIENIRNNHTIKVNERSKRNTKKEKQTNRETLRRSQRNTKNTNKRIKKEEKKKNNSPRNDSTTNT